MVIAHFETNQRCLRGFEVSQEEVLPPRTICGVLDYHQVPLTSFLHSHFHISWCKALFVRRYLLPDLSSAWWTADGKVTTPGDDPTGLSTYWMVEWPCKGTSLSATMLVASSLAATQSTKNTSVRVILIIEWVVVVDFTIGKAFRCKALFKCAVQQQERSYPRNTSEHCSRRHWKEKRIKEVLYQKISRQSIFRQSDREGLSTLKTTVEQKIQVEPSTGSWETRLTTCGLGFSLTSTAI